MNFIAPLICPSTFVGCKLDQNFNKVSVCIFTTVWDTT